MANKVYLRDTLGRFRNSGRAGTGKKVKTTRGLGKSRGGKRDTGSLSAGGKIAGVEPNKAAKKLTGSGEEAVSGSKLKR